MVEVRTLVSEVKNEYMCHYQEHDKSYYIQSLQPFGDSTVSKTLPQMNKKEEDDGGGRGAAKPTGTSNNLDEV